MCHIFYLRASSNVAHFLGYWQWPHTESRRQYFCHAPLTQWRKNLQKSFYISLPIPFIPKLLAHPPFKELKLVRKICPFLAVKEKKLNRLQPKTRHFLIATICTPIFKIAPMPYPYAPFQLCSFGAVSVMPSSTYLVWDLCFDLFFLCVYRMTEERVQSRRTRARPCTLVRSAQNLFIIFIYLLGADVSPTHKQKSTINDEYISILYITISLPTVSIAISDQNMKIVRVLCLRLFFFVILSYGILH